MAYYSRALIVGAGEGISASLARIFTREGGMRVGLASRNIARMTTLATELNAALVQCDATKPQDVESLFTRMERDLGDAPDVVVYNPGLRIKSAFIDLKAEDVERALAVNVFGGFLVAQQAARRMLPKRRGAILFTGASASVKGFARSTAFAMGKFALRGLAQSMARELAPEGIHVAHFVIDGSVRGARHPEPKDAPDSMLDPDAIARSYLSVLQQDRSAWTWEVELRPWVERF